VRIVVLFFGRVDAEREIEGEGDDELRVRLIPSMVVVGPAVAVDLM
jgi:hypothetical protein